MIGGRMARIVLVLIFLCALCSHAFAVDATAWENTGITKWSVGSPILAVASTNTQHTDIVGQKLSILRAQYLKECENNSIDKAGDESCLIEKLRKWPDSWIVDGGILVDVEGLPYGIKSVFISTENNDEVKIERFVFSLKDNGLKFSDLQLRYGARCSRLLADNRFNKHLEYVFGVKCDSGFFPLASLKYPVRLLFSQGMSGGIETVGDRPNESIRCSPNGATGCSPNGAIP
jgi:hypothetical protein